MSRPKIEVAYQYLLDNYNNGEDFRFDILSNKVQVCEKDSISHDILAFRDVTNRDYCTIAIRCARETGVNITPQDIHSLLQSELVPTVHPLRDWLNQLKPYPADCPIDWIGNLANQVHVKGGPEKQQLWQNCFRKWFLSMVATWRFDEETNHQVLILVGPQGIYKTSWLKSLLPPCLRAYLCDQASSHELSKDERMRIAEFGLINLDEIDAMTTREMNVLKSVITATDVNERAAYAITKERRIRVASFCGSGNNPRFLTDDTGNRRWLPFEVESIDSPFTNPLQYEMIYAQAIYLIDHHYPYRFEKEDIEALAVHNADYRAPRNEDDLLPVYFTPATKDDPSARFMTASEIHSCLKVNGHIEHPMPINKFGRLLCERGFERKTIQGRTGYSVIMNTHVADDQISLAQQALLQ